MKKITYIASLAIVSLVLIVSCKPDLDPLFVPDSNAAVLSSITAEATLGGAFVTVTLPPGSNPANLMRRGFQISSHEDFSSIVTLPLIPGGTQDLSGVGGGLWSLTESSESLSDLSFTVRVSGLEADSTYFIRSFTRTSGAGTTFGESVSFVPEPIIFARRAFPIVGQWQGEGINWQWQWAAGENPTERNWSTSIVADEDDENIFVFSDFGTGSPFGFRVHQDNNGYYYFLNNDFIMLDNNGDRVIMVLCYWEGDGVFNFGTAQFPVYLDAAQDGSIFRLSNAPIDPNDPQDRIGLAMAVRHAGTWPSGSLLGWYTATIMWDLVFTRTGAPATAEQLENVEWIIPSRNQTNPKNIEREKAPTRAFPSQNN